MESTTRGFYSAVATAISVVVLLRWLVSGRRSRRNLPPGPTPLPIIGNLHLIGALPHQSIHEITKKHGPVVRLRFGSMPVVVGASAEAARQLLKTNDLAVADRPRTAAGRYTTYNYSDMTWSSYGAYWRQARKMWALELFSARRLDSYEYIRVEEVRALLAGLSRSAGATVDLKDRLSTVSLNVISRMVLGKKYHDGSACKEATAAVVSPAEFKRMLDELFLLNGVMNIGDVIPWIDFLDLQGYVRRMKAVSKKFDVFLEHVLDEHEERRRAAKEEGAYAPKDMVDVLLQLAEDPSLDVKLTRNGVKAFTQDLIAGGTESSAVTVEWAMSELLRRPDVVAKATEELDRVVGHARWVEEGDMPRLPYVESIVKETMRLHPVAPLLVPRLAREDCTVCGYDVPAGTQVLVNVWTIGRDPAAWEAPLEFRPERFLEREVDVRGHDYELLPFGSGRRMCPGYSLGLKVVQSTLANLLHGFSWALPEGLSPEGLSMEEIFGLSTPRKVPLEAVPSPRLPPHLYLP